MPLPVNDQWDAVFATPIPFLLAVGFVAAGIWAAMLWRYKAVNEKQTELYELLTKKTDLATEEAIKTQDELRSTIVEQTKQIERLSAQQNLPEETRGRRGARNPAKQGAPGGDRIDDCMSSAAPNFYRSSRRGRRGGPVYDYRVTLSECNEAPDPRPN